MKTCTIDGCDKAHRAKGYCSSHYSAILDPDRHVVTRACDECGETYTTTRTNGQYCSLLCRDVVRSRHTASRKAALPPKAKVPPKDQRGPLRRAVEEGDHRGVIAALKARTVTTIAGCWEWQGTIKDGYPVALVGGRTCYAHRLALEAHLGAPLGAQPAHHICANTTCINPQHLQPVTHRENMAEMLARNYMVQRIVDLEAALALAAPQHPLLNEVGLPNAV